MTNNNCDGSEYDRNPNKSGDPLLGSRQHADQPPHAASSEEAGLWESPWGYPSNGKSHRAEEALHQKGVGML
jgi:hypothetical protein